MKYNIYVIIFNIIYASILMDLSGGNIEKITVENIKIDSEATNTTTKTTTNTATKTTTNTSINETSNLNLYNKTFKRKTKNTFKDTILHWIFNKTLQQYFQYIIGNYYVWLHVGIMAMGIYLILFSMNPYSLLCVITILAIDAFTIIIMHDCPLTMLERYYIKNSSVYWRLNKLRNCGIKYSLENEYDIQLEVVINGAAIAIFKLFCIIILKSKPFI